MIETMAQNGPMRHRSHTGGVGKRATAQKARGPAFHHGVVLPPPPIGFAQKREPHPDNNVQMRLSYCTYRRLYICPFSKMWERFGKTCGNYSGNYRFNFLYFQSTFSRRRQPIFREKENPQPLEKPRNCGNFWRRRWDLNPCCAQHALLP